MQLILMINTSHYTQPYSIKKGSSVAPAFSDTLENHPFLRAQGRPTKRLRKQLTIPK